MNLTKKILMKTCMHIENKLVDGRRVTIVKFALNMFFYTPCENNVEGKIDSTKFLIQKST